jgi:methionyl-tRNA formyltransferase
MKVVFFGTSQFAVASLQALKESKHNIEAVFTQPDRKGGRYYKTIESPVKRWALKAELPLYQPADILRIKPKLEEIKADLFVVVGYGSILPSEIINLPRFYSVNIHPSLLPEYRGAAPVNWTIIAGKEETGVTIFRLSPKMDAGEIILQKKVKIKKEDTSITLDRKLSKVGADLLLEALDLIENKKVNFRPQDDKSATYAPKLKKEDGLIDWSKPARRIYNLIRGTKDWPSAYTYLEGKILKIHTAELMNGSRSSQKARPGEIIEIRKNNGIIVQTAEGLLNILTLQLEGRKKISSSQFILGHNVKEGDLLGKD